MAAFLYVKEKDSECLSIIIMFLFTIIFIVIGYEKVNDHKEKSQDIELEMAKITENQLAG